MDIAEAQLSKQLAAEAAANVAPMHAMLDFWRALRWLIPGWPVDKISKLSKLLKVTKDEPNPLLDGLVKLLDPSHNLVTVLSDGKLEGSDAAIRGNSSSLVSCAHSSALKTPCARALCCSRVQRSRWCHFTR